MSYLTGSFGRVVGFLSIYCWGSLSSSYQCALSAFFAKVYQWPISKVLIAPYCLFQYRDPFYYRKFKPGQGNTHYKSFQDFFTRELPESPEIVSEYVWPCEGLLCEVNQVSKISKVNVKGNIRCLKTIFGRFSNKIEDHYYFSNIFLHNRNYHHIHSPVKGTVVDIEHIPGELLLLRPWAYKKIPSLPAITNERINVEIKDEQNRSWFLSIVGGPLVATIETQQSLAIANVIHPGEKIASFKLGSTCCMISPVAPAKKHNSDVCMGHPLS